MFFSLIEINIKAKFYRSLFHNWLLYTVNYRNMYKHHLNQDYIYHYFGMVSVDSMDLNLKRPFFLSFIWTNHFWLYIDNSFHMNLLDMNKCNYYHKYYKYLHFDMDLIHMDYKVLLLSLLLIRQKKTISKNYFNNYVANLLL